MTEGLYTHPNIRDVTRSELEMRLEALRGRRLLVAIEARDKIGEKLRKERTKADQQWNKAAERVQKRLLKMNEDIERTETDLKKMATLDHQLAGLEGNQEQLDNEA